MEKGLPTDWAKANIYPAWFLIIPPITILNSEGIRNGHIIKWEEKEGTKEIIHGVTMKRKSILKRNRTEFLEPLNKR